MNIQAIKNTGLGILLTALTACASSSILVGTAREPVEPEQVKIYLEPPAGYETVALLEASDLGANGFSAQSRMNKVINRLKAEAADLGANGILLQGIDTQITGAVNSGFASATMSGNSAYATGMGYSAAQTSKVGRAIAIYVSQGTPVTATTQQSRSIESAAPTTISTPTSNSTNPAATQSNWQKWGEKRD